MSDEISFFKKTFWDLWFQKIFRNFASMKFQWLTFLYIPTIWGMFHMQPDDKTPWVSATVGFTFLGGGFITLAITRIIARTKLMEDSDVDSLLDKKLDTAKKLDTDK
jgi:hypothetical protein